MSASPALFSASPAPAAAVVSCGGLRLPGRSASARRSDFTELVPTAWRFDPPPRQPSACFPGPAPVSQLPQQSNFTGLVKNSQRSRKIIPASLKRKGTWKGKADPSNFREAHGLSLKVKVWETAHPGHWRRNGSGQRARRERSRSQYRPGPRSRSNTPRLPIAPAEPRTR